ncbi:MAG: Rieske 2Fe-2S domain-containing protein [Phycisphaerales bacterium]
MSVGYAWVRWNRHKRVYDGLVAAAALAYVGLFVAVSKAVWTGADAHSDEVLIIRALGSCAFLLLHLILCIGPLARLERRFLPLLYNRRHLGVITFLIALAHGVLSLGYYHGFGVVDPLRSLLTSNTNYGSLSAFPFQALGVLGLGVLFLMAATSHDFWLKNLSAAAWKRLHMLVYPAYAALVGHVALGALQGGRGWVGFAAVSAGVSVVCSLHLWAGWREVRRDAGIEPKAESRAGWIDVGAPDEIPIDRARTVCTPGGERIAVFRHGGAISAVSNVCRHQGGPLGEGKIIDGCITCPWHGWQYRPEDGCSPPPFKEKVATFQVRISAGRLQVNTAVLPPGRATAPALIKVGAHG